MILSVTIIALTVFGVCRDKFYSMNSMQEAFDAYQQLVDAGAWVSGSARLMNKDLRMDVARIYGDGLANGERMRLVAAQLRDDQDAERFSITKYLKFQMEIRNVRQATVALSLMRPAPAPTEKMFVAEAR